jgi:hypothetical protein
MYWRELLKYAEHDLKWAMDELHIEWLREILGFGFKRTLEIGSYNGSSLTAFLDAKSCGDVTEVHVCDVHVRQPLLHVIAASEIEVILHQRRSVDLLTEDSNFEFVLVDGDHSIENVRKEMTLLLASGVESIFVHDTTARVAKYPHVEGSEIAKTMLMGSPAYYCLEDSIPRPGMATDRGALFATQYADIFEYARSAYYEIFCKRLH